MFMLLVLVIIGIFVLFIMLMFVSFILLFFMWGFIIVMNDILILYFKVLFEFNFI